MPILMLATTGCGTARQHGEYEELAGSTMSSPTIIPKNQTDRADPSLAREAPLDTIIRIALGRNPDVQEAQLRVQAGLAAARAASRWPDLQFKYEQWGVPLDRPLAIGDAQTLMLGLRQEFPPVGSRRARSKEAVQEGWVALANQHMREQDLVARVRRAYFDSYRAEREYEIHLQHAELADRIVAVARSNYQAGRGTQQDVLRAVVELSRLHSDLAGIEQERRSSRALLNTLMARPPDAPLAAPRELTPTQARLQLQALQSELETHRPELQVAERRVRRDEAALAVAKSAARWPTIMVGADYWLMPKSEPRHAYGAMVSMSLPWLNPAHRDEVRQAEAILNAERRARESVYNTALFELHDALARLDAAREAFAVLERDLLPQARQSFESAQASYGSGQGNALAVLDALRSYLDVRLARSRALAKVEASLSDVERSVGTSLRDAGGSGQ